MPHADPLSLWPLRSGLFGVKRTKMLDSPNDKPLTNSDEGSRMDFCEVRRQSKKRTARAVPPATWKGNA